jgi:pilus assembly protein Flp/PilA
VSFLPGVRSRDEGVTSIEYALIAASIAIAIVAGATLLGVNLQPAFNTVAAAL